MDEKAIKRILETWIVTAEAAREREHNEWGGADTVSDWADRDDLHLRSLQEREDQVRQLLKHVLKLDHLPTVLDGSSGSMVYVRGGIDQCRYALGVIATAAETKAMLGPTAPTMAADLLHPGVWAIANGLWQDGHYRGAVQKACTWLNVQIQHRTGRRTVSDRVLMQQTFSTASPTEEQPRLWWPGDYSDQSVKAMRDGIRDYAQGVFSAIRNLTTHSTDELDEQQAFEMLTAVSLLARWVDQCELETAT